MNIQGPPFDLEMTGTVLKRIAEIYNGIAREALVTLNYNCLIDFVENPDDGSLELWIKDCERPLSDERLWPEEAPEHVYMAAMSFSCCVKTILMCTGILAYIIEGMQIKRMRTTD
jgi:hypothetical protein